MDYTIIGAGPCGLTVAWILSNYGKKCVIIDREDSIGGCHRVRRTKEGYFTEHGPRIYINNFVCFIALLKDMGIDFYDIFVPYTKE